MALNTYALLQTSIADQLNRTDLTAEIKDAILLTEKRLNRVLKYTKLEKQLSLTLFLISVILEKLFFVKTCPIFDGSTLLLFTKYQNFLWV